MTLGTCRHCGAPIMQGALGCLGCGRLVDDHDTSQLTGIPQTQLGTQAKQALLDSRWRLVQPLGRGKNTTTWLAHDGSFDRKVVVKLLDEAAARDPAQVERFEHNARRLARVEHKNVVAVLSLGRHGEVPYVTMQKAEGRSLAEHLHARGGRLSLTETAAIVGQLAEAFEAVHLSGGPQGGLTPRAVFVSEADGRVTLLDVRAAPDPAVDVTAPTLQLAERLEWVAPEVLAGGAPTVVSDVFTLGCVAWELACGTPPPRGSAQALLSGNGGPVPPPALPDEPASAALRDAIVRATHPDPAQRFTGASELQKALPLPAAPAPPAPTPTPTPQLDPVSVPAAAPTARVESPPPEFADARTAPNLALAPEPYDPPPTRRIANRPSPPRRRGLVLGYTLALLLAGVVGWLVSRPADKPPPPLPIDRSTQQAPAGPPPEAGLALESALEKQVAPESVQERRQTFEKTYADEPGKGRGRLKVRARSHPQVADFIGRDGKRKETVGELQVMVLYGNHEVSIDVSIDGRRIGPSPIFWPLPPGNHVITIERAGLEPVKVPVVIVRGKSLRMEIELEPLD